MPTYTYRCTKCDTELEVVQAMSDPPLKRCRKCRGVLRRTFHPVGIVLKGPGFHRTDYRTKSSKTSSEHSSDGSTDSSKDSSGSGEKAPGSKATQSKSTETKASESKASESKSSGSPSKDSSD